MVVCRLVGLPKLKGLLQLFPDLALGIGFVSSLVSMLSQLHGVLVIPHPWLCFSFGYLMVVLSLEETKALGYDCLKERVVKNSGLRRDSLLS